MNLNYILLFIHIGRYKQSDELDPMDPAAYSDTPR